MLEWWVPKDRFVVINWPSPRAVCCPPGLDSLGSVEVRNLLQDSLRLQLPATVLYDYPSVNSLADHLVSVSLLADTRSAPPPSPTPTTPSLGAPSSPRAATVWATAAAVRSCGGVLEGGIRARDVVRPVPLGRWDVEAGTAAAGGSSVKTGSRFGAYMLGVEMFDAQLSGLSSTEAALMDPQQVGGFHQGLKVPRCKMGDWAWGMMDVLEGWLCWMASVLTVDSSVSIRA